MIFSFLLLFLSFIYLSRVKSKVKRRRAWQMPFTEASQRHDNQRHVKQTMISSPIYDARKEAYQHHGNEPRENE